MIKMLQQTERGHSQKKGSGLKKVGIVICNYNRAQDVCNCIQSVTESLYTDYQIYVVDNASTDGSREAIRQMFGDTVELIVNPANLGGSGGFNAGLRRAYEQGHTYLWCLDNDVLVDENALGALVDFLDEHHDCGMAGSRVDHMEDPDHVQQYGINIYFEDFRVEAKYLGYAEDGTLPKVVYSDAVAACSVLVRSSMIPLIGFLPEENFLYWDDTEWGWRCNLAGFRVASVGASIVLHRMGAKKEPVNTFPTYYAWRNRFRFFAKYTPAEYLDSMYDSLLGDLFDSQYDDWRHSRWMRSRTTMLAFLDAAHCVTGPAGSGRIFDLTQPGANEMASELDATDRRFVFDGDYYKVAKEVFLHSMRPVFQQFVEELRDSCRNDPLVPRML